MEDDDFGFTKRKECLLRKVIENSETENIAERLSNNENSSEKTKSDSAGVGNTGESPKVVEGDGGSVIPDESEGVTSEDGGGSARSRSGRSSEGGTSPETGNEEANKRTDRAEASVAPQTPNIPNVVEYHLKVKPGPRDHVEFKRPEDEDLSKKKDHEQSQENMRNDGKTSLSSSDDNGKLTRTLSKLSIDNNVFEGSTDLPQVFQVKYLGSHDARGLWGIKHTRKPVDNMVASAKSLPTDTILPLVKLVVSHDGVSLSSLGKRKTDVGISKIHPIESISYGVQDLVYTRVFSMIVVRDNGNFRRVSPFECHAFVCESKHHARQLTYALATAFQIYSQNVKALGKSDTTTDIVKKRFAIDLRSPEEIETDLNVDSEA